MLYNFSQMKSCFDSVLSKREEDELGGLKVQLKERERERDRCIIEKSPNGEKS